MLSKTSPKSTAAALVATLACAAGALSACGSSHSTAATSTSTPTAPAQTQTLPTTTATTTAPPRTTTTTPAPAQSSNGGTPASPDQTSGTRTGGAAPAFVHPPSNSGAAAAVALLSTRGYAASDPAQFHPNQTLQVLVGTRSGSGQQAFFFIDGRYVGTDASRPSGQLHVLDQSDTEVTLGYSLYRPNDQLCCPGGGMARVRFALDNGKLTPLDAIPSDAARR